MVLQMKSNKYWKKRSEKRMDYAILKADEISNKIGKAYLEALQDIQSSIEKIYRNFAKGISEAEAEKILNNIKPDSILSRLKEAVSNIEDEDVKTQMLAQINAPAYKSRLEHLKQLAENAKQTCENIAGNTVVLMDNGLSDIIKNCYYRSIYDTQKGTGIAFNFSRISENTLKEILRTNWSGKHYSERVWDNTNKLTENLQNELIKGVLTGKSSGRMANDIQQVMHSSYSRTLTLVRTESSYVNNQAELESYNKIGVKKYKYVATLDSRTSELCRELDGKEFEVSKAQTGTNYPPMHPRCRSTTISVINNSCYDKLKRSARDRNGDIQYVPENMTYKEWKERYLSTADGLGNIGVGKYSKSIDKSGESGIMKMGKTKSPIQKPPDFTKYEVKEDKEAVNRVKQTLINDFGLDEKDIQLDGIKNADVLEPFVKRLNKIRQETGFILPNVKTVDIIDGDQCCISSYKPYENSLYISSKYFNSKKALEDTLKEWSSNKILPKQAKSIQFLAEHEAAHIRIPKQLIESEKGFNIFKRAVKAGVCANDMNIYEFYADSMALSRIGHSDKIIELVIKYLQQGGIG